MSRRFNLQPWRAAQRKAQKNQFLAVAAAVGLASAGLIGGYWFLKQSYVDGQVSAIATLDKEIKSLENTQKEVERMKKLNEEVTRQISVIQELQDRRGLTIEFLDYIAGHLPETVFLENMRYSKSQLTISGVAETEMGVSAFIRVLQDYRHFSSVRLVTMNQAINSKRYSVPAGTGVRTFELVVQVDPNYDEAPQ